MTLREAIGLSAEANPELKAFAYELRAQDGRTLQAGLKPNPELLIDLEDALGTGARRGLAGAQSTIALRQQFERGGSAVRVAAARAGRTVLDAELVEKQLEVSVETARRFAQVLSDQVRLQLASEAITLAKQTTESVRRRVQAAKAPDAELARALAQLARAELHHEDVEHELLTAKHQLAAMWGANFAGEGQLEFDHAAGSIENFPKLAAFQHYATGLEANPGLQKFRTVTQLREAELQLAEQRRKPAWELHAGVRRFEQGNDFAGIVGVSIPLAWNDRGQGQTATARANLAKVDADHNAVRVALRAELFAVYQELAHALHVIEKLDRDVLPRMRDALQQTEYAYQRGRYGYLELVAAQRELFEVRSTRMQAASDAIGYAIEIDRLTGQVPGSTGALSQMREKAN